MGRYPLAVLGGLIVFVLGLGFLSGLRPAQAGPLPRAEMAVDLGVAVSRGGVSAVAGEVLTYSIDFWNNGPDISQGTLLTVVLPIGSTFSGASLDGAPQTPVRNGSDFRVLSLGDTQQGTVELAVRLAPVVEPSGQVTLTARIDAAEPDSDPSNNESSDVADLAAPDLVLQKDLDTSVSIPAPGGVITYVLSVRNQGAATADPFTLTDPLPAGLAFLAAETGEGLPLTPTVRGQQVAIVGPSLEAGGEYVVHIGASVSLSVAAGTILTNTAALTATGPDLDLTNHTASLGTELLVEVPDPFVSLSSWGDDEVGLPKILQLSYGNAGGLDAQGVVVSVTLPVSLTYSGTSGTMAPTVQGRTLVWSLGTLGRYTEVAEPINISTTINSAGTIRVGAGITGTNGDSAPENNQAMIGFEAGFLSAPRFLLPTKGSVLPRPSLIGEARADSTLNLYVDGRFYVAGPTGGDATFWITGTVPITNGDHVFTATSQLGAVVSPASDPITLTVVDYLRIDPMRTKLHDVPLGAVGSFETPFLRGDQTIQIAIVDCASPVSVTLTITQTDSNDEIVSRREYTPTVTNAAAREYTFLINIAPETADVEVIYGYTCDRGNVAGGQSGARAAAGAGAQPVASGGRSLAAGEPRSQEGLICRIFGGFDFAGASGLCPPPPPPKPKFPPFQPPRRPIDPDGFVYDAAIAATKPITRALITNAWVTLTVRTEEGTWVLWNGAEVNGQVNPQYTDGTHPDKVLTPGYYSFFVFPGEYRVSARAPGYKPYDSDIIRVVSTPVTLHVPMQRLQGNPTGGQAGPAPGGPGRVYLPLVNRRNTS